MVAQKRSRVQRNYRGNGQAAQRQRQRQRAALLARKAIKVKKKVTWDKTIAIREEELKEMENEEGEGTLSLVTFVRKVDIEDGGDKSPRLSSYTSKHRFRFRLEGGRVDVPQVLGRLGISRLQYELEPGSGIWQILEGSTSGKSTAMFKSGQVISFRDVPDFESDFRGTENSEEEIEEHPIFPIKCRSAASKSIGALPPEASLRNPSLRGIVSPWVDKWIVEGDTVEDYYSRVSRLLEDRTSQGGGLCGIGVVLRLAFHRGHTRLLLSCRHIVDRDGFSHPRTRGPLYAFGGPVKVLHVSKKYDLALLQGPPLDGSVTAVGFDLAEEGEEQPGREVRLLTFPWYLDNVWGRRPLEDVLPSQMPGHIASMGARRRHPSGGGPILVDTFATYMGGLPGCSGGAVTLNSKILCGVHSGVYPGRQSTQENHRNVVVNTGNKSPVSQSTSVVSIQEPGPLNTRLKKCSSKRLRKHEGPAESGSPKFTKCMSTHGYLAVYASSSHIRETCLEWYAKPSIKRLLNGMRPQNKQ